MRLPSPFGLFFEIVRKVVVMEFQLPFDLIFFQCASLTVGLEDTQRAHSIKGVVSGAGGKAAMLVDILSNVVSLTVYELDLQQTDEVAMSGQFGPGLIVPIDVCHYFYGLGFDGEMNFGDGTL